MMYSLFQHSLSLLFVLVVHNSTLVCAFFARRRQRSFSSSSSELSEQRLEDKTKSNPNCPNNDFPQDE